MFGKFRAVYASLVRRSTISNTHGKHKGDLMTINKKNHVEHFFEISSRIVAILRGRANVSLADSNAELPGFGYKIVIVSQGRCCKDSIKAEG
jgi:hypothetical protein